MGTEKLETIIGNIRKGNINKKTKVAIIENGTLSSQRIITGEIGDIAQKSKDENVKPPAIIIIGETVTLSDTIGWYSQSDTTTQEKENTRK
jgi:siroheme synthase